MRLKNTNDIDELDHGHAELDSDCVGQVLNGSDEWVVALGAKQMVDQSDLIVTAQTCGNMACCVAIDTESSAESW